VNGPPWGRGLFLELDGRGPRHAQLTRALKEAIRSGRLPAHTRLPPTRELALSLGLSRSTALAAYEQLQAEGFLESRQGSGSFVAPQQVAPTPSKVPPAIEVAPPSRYVKRLREGISRAVGRRHYGLRYNLQYAEPLVQPGLAERWSKEIAHAAAYTDTDYPRTQGLPALREGICDYLARRRGVVASPDDVIIVNGAQQAYSLCARVLLDEGDRVALEDPHYFSAYQIMRVHGAEIVGVRTDEDGMVCEELPAEPARLVCVTPSHQFPGASLMSLPRRLQLIAYAEKHGSWILEDDYDGELRFDGHPLAALRALDEAARVIYVGTFSKVLFPSLRLGYMVVPPALREDFLAAKWLSDLASPAIEQAALAALIADGSFERFLRAGIKDLKLRRDTLLDGLHTHVGDRLEIYDPPAGMHIVGWFHGIDEAHAERLIEHAASRGLGLHPMAPFYLDPPSRPGLLLGYAGMSCAEIREATRLFGSCLRELGL